ncbi:hypothetical protein Tco_0995709 [Tanacetum coccineum]
MVEKQIKEDRGRQMTIMNLAREFDNACTAKDELRKAYEEYIDISLEQRVLIEIFQKIESDKDYEMHNALVLELANTPLNENCSVVILKKLPKKLRDPGKILIPCSFSELKCKALADLETILCDGDERLTLNMRHDTSSYSNKPKKESINMIDIYNVSHEDYLEDLFANEKITNHLSGNPTPILDLIVSSSPTLTSLEESDLIEEEFKAYLASDSFPPRSDDTDFDPEGDLCLIEELLKNDPSSPLPLSHNPLSGSTTSSSPDHLLEEFADELALITFPLGNDDLPFDIESDLREIEYLLNHDSILKDSVDESNFADPNNDLVDTIPEMFTDKHTLDYSSPPSYDDVDDDLVELESDNDDVYDDPFDSKEDKIKESKLLIDELDPPRSSDFLPSPEYDLVLYEDFSEVDALPSTNNEDKKISISNASLILEDFNPPLYELPFHKEVPGSETLLSFSFKNEEKVFNPGILTSKGVHTSLLLELSHRGPKAFKVTKNFECPMDIFPCSYREDIRVLDVPCLHFYPP